MASGDRRARADSEDDPRRGIAQPVEQRENRRERVEIQQRLLQRGKRGQLIVEQHARAVGEQLAAHFLKDRLDAVDDRLQVDQRDQLREVVGCRADRREDLIDQRLQPRNAAIRDRDPVILAGVATPRPSAAPG